MGSRAGLDESPSAQFALVSCENAASTLQALVQLEEPAGKTAATERVIRCMGLTRQGTCCKWTSLSELSVATPLRSGGRFCLFHLDQAPQKLDGMKQRRLDSFFDRLVARPPLSDIGTNNIQPASITDVVPQLPMVAVTAVAREDLCASPLRSSSLPNGEHSALPEQTAPCLIAEPPQNDDDDDFISPTQMWGNLEPTPPPCIEDTFPLEVDVAKDEWASISPTLWQPCPQFDPLAEAPVAAAGDGGLALSQEQRCRIVDNRQKALQRRELKRRTSDENAPLLQGPPSLSQDQLGRIMVNRHQALERRRLKRQESSSPAPSEMVRTLSQEQLDRIAANRHLALERQRLKRQESAPEASPKRALAVARSRTPEARTRGRVLAQHLTCSPLQCPVARRLLSSKLNVEASKIDQ